MAGARHGQPARVRAPQRGASARLGLPRRFFTPAGVETGSGRFCLGLNRTGFAPLDMEELILAIVHDMFLYAVRLGEATAICGGRRCLCLVGDGGLGEFLTRL